MSHDQDLQADSAGVSLQIDFARELNEQQYAAVMAAPGPALVIAGAGAGKTRTLIYRVAFLLEQGVPAERLLLVTFTNKAAGEMMRRVGDLLGSSLADLWGGTFHSIGHRILRQNAACLGYSPDFTILDREDSNEIIKACIGDADLRIAGKRPKADVIGDILSFAANTQAPLVDVVREGYAHFQDETDHLVAIQQNFAARKRNANVMDFDDLLVLWLKLLRDQPEIREYYQRRFQFILVDEYQDTNRIQADLIDTLAARHRNVMVVGDDSQSIYSWRGANFLNILRFPERYPDARLYKIELNYRSTPEILRLANSVIAHNRQQFAKELAAVCPRGPKPMLVACYNPAQQAKLITREVMRLRTKGVVDIAVLYRSHFHALDLQLELTRQKLPFSITSGIRVFEQAHIKDVTAYLKWVHNPRDEVAFKRAVALMPGVAAKTADKLWLATQEFLAANSAKVAPPHAALAAAKAKAPGRALEAWTDFIELVRVLEDPALTPTRMIETICERGYEAYLQLTYPNYRARLDDLQQLSAYAEQFESLTQFLGELALLSEIESDAAARRDDHLRLSTIHQAKGLEFDAVIVMMLCEGCFPTLRSIKRPETLEEERRLFYVAVTRARRHLYLTFPQVRFTAGMLESQDPSRFLKEISSDLVDCCDLSREFY